MVLFEKVKKKEVASCIMEMNYIQVEYLSMLSPVHCLHSSRIFVYVKSCSVFIVYIAIKWIEHHCFFIGRGNTCALCCRIDKEHGSWWHGRYRYDKVTAGVQWWH